MVVEEVVVDDVVVDEVVVDEVLGRAWTRSSGVVVAEVVVVVAAVTDRLSCWGALASGCCDESVAVTVTVELKGAEGVPLMTPVVASSVSPVGSPTAAHV